MILYSPAEPAPMVRALGQWFGDEVQTDERCEEYGVDFLWRARGHWWGVQRKAVPDLLSSLDDGRLYKEMMQMKAHITVPILMIEGRMMYTNGYLVQTWRQGREISRRSMENRITTIQSNDIIVRYSVDQFDTAEQIRYLYDWSLTEQHTTASTRPKPAGDWGKLTNRDFQIHMLSGLPQVGRKTAEAILDHFGYCPIRLDVGAGELAQVPGIGPATAKRIVEAMEQ